MRLLQHRITGPDPCPYLPDIPSETETMLMTGVAPLELEKLLERGWRRFGPVYFRPVCPSCSQCVSIRVPVKTFAPSPNLKRVMKRAAGLRVQVGKPIVDEKRLALYHRWHANREAQRGWKPDRIEGDSYAMQFCFPHQSAREFSYWQGETLVGIGITDETPRALSAVYCFHDPSLSQLSIGTYNVLRSIEYARERDIEHVYLGYRVEGCASLEYKGRFLPQERLEGRVEGEQAPRWQILR
jgi:arginyl-tRNA--protein-N-Asp/Glu arginylyltransferase